MLLDSFYRRRIQKHIQLEGYVERWNKTDARVRENVSIAAYIESVRAPTIAEWWKQRALIAAAKRIEPSFVKATKYRILMFGRGEGGMPHTHGPYIMLPIDMPILAATLVHEKIHVYQRYHPIETALDAAEKYAITGFEYPDLGQRANPDTSRILYGDMRPTYTPNAKTLADIQDLRDHPHELEAYARQQG